MKSEFSTVKDHLDEFPDIFEIFDNFFDELWALPDLVSIQTQTSIT